MDIRPAVKSAGPAATPQAATRKDAGRAEPALVQAIGSDKKSLAIALAVALSFLLAALGIATWLFTHKQNSPQANNTAPTDSRDPSKAKKVAWVAPVTMPANYVLSRRDTLVEHTAMYYADAGTGCAIKAQTFPAEKDNQKAAVAANDTTGITTTTTASDDLKDMKLGDMDGEHTYAFAGFESDQKVDVPGVDFTAQSGATYYLQFGQRLATVGFTCKQASFDAKAEELTTLIRQFTVATEY